MRWLANARTAMVRLNLSLEGKLTPRQVNLMESYKAALCVAPFSYALHLGCGRDMYRLSPLLADKGKVIGLDLDLQGLKRNGSTLKVRGDAVALPFASETFDLVFSEYTLEHLAKPWLTLAEVDRVLVPGGSVIILVPNRRHYYAWVAKYSPFWFHRLWLKWAGHRTTDIDAFPTRHRWGALTDFYSSTKRFCWDLIKIHSVPGPTGYTRWLPVHALFVIADRLLAKWQSMHLIYVVHFRKVR